MEGVIDTNVLVDYFLLESPNHNLARASLEKIDRGFLPSVVVEELISVLAKAGVDKRTINDRMQEVLKSYEILGIGSGGLSEAMSLIMSEGGISFKQFNDKLILALAKAEDMPLLTLDKELARECKANGVELLSE